MKILSVVVRLRPNFMKIAPIISAIESYNAGSFLFSSISGRHKIDHVLVHTGQHYDKAMSDSFFHDLRIPKPNMFLRGRLRNARGPDFGDHAKIRPHFARSSAGYYDCCRRRQLNSGAAPWLPSKLTYGNGKRTPYRSRRSRAEIFRPHHARGNKPADREIFETSCS